VELSELIKFSLSEASMPTIRSSSAKELPNKTSLKFHNVNILCLLLTLPLDHALVFSSSSITSPPNLYIWSYYKAVIGTSNGLEHPMAYSSHPNSCFDTWYNAFLVAIGTFDSACFLDFFIFFFLSLVMVASLGPRLNSRCEESDARSLRGRGVELGNLKP
jgi:hypothetical protein